MTRQRLELGFAFNLGLTDTSRAGTARLYDEVLDTIRYAEAVGLDGVWVGQHHFDITPGPVPSPLVLLAAAARETTRIDLGTGIVTLPLEDPLRLAEDAAVLDVLAGGRLHLGLGTGGANLGGFEAFGHSPADRHRLYDEKVARLETALTGQPLSGQALSGRTLTGQPLSVGASPGGTLPAAGGATEGAGPRLQPYLPGLSRRVWEGVTSEERARSAARADHGIQVGAFFDPAGAGQLPKVAAYVDELRRAHPGSAPRVGAFRFLYVGDHKDAVVREVGPHLSPRLPVLAERAALSGNRALTGLSVREYLDRVALYGSPDDVVQSIDADPVLAEHGTHLVANSSFHDTFDAGHARRQIDALVSEVGPALGWSPALAA